MPDARSAARLAWTAWLLLFAAAAAMAVSGNRHTVTPAYREAAAHWVRGLPLYDDTGHGFIYLPDAAVLWVPFAALPAPVGVACWRLATIGAFALGVRRLAGFVRQPAGRDAFPLMTIVCLPLAVDCARSGQATLLDAALMILGLADLAEGRWATGAAWLVTALAVKPMAVPLVVIAACVYVRARRPLALGVAILLLSPFLFQRPSYVIDQYRGWVTMAGAASRLGQLPRWAHLFSMLSIAGLPVPTSVQTAVRIAAGAAVVWLAAAARRRHAPPWAAVLIFSLSGCFLMLFSPRTENNTYAALAPAVGAFFAAAWRDDRRLLAATFVVIALGMLGSYEVGHLLTPSASPTWLAPLVTTGFTAFVVAGVFAPSAALV